MGSKKPSAIGPEHIQEDLLPLAIDIDSPALDPRNARIHPDENIEQIKLSFLAYGQCKPVVINKHSGIIEAGNGMVIAARKLGWKRIAVTRADHDPAQATGYGIMDNKAGLSSAWDMPMLKDLFEELDTGDFNMDWTGFDRMEIQDLMTQVHVPEEGLIDVDAVPEATESICRRGDLWSLGNHRLLCGDATVITDVERLMDGQKADMVWTDPPYGVDIQERDLVQANIRGRRKDGKGIANDELTGAALRAFLDMAFTNTFMVSKKGACWYVSAPSGVDYRHPLNSLEILGIARHGIVWVKDRFVMGRCDYHYRHENIIYGWVDGAPHQEVPTRDQDSVWEYPLPGRRPEHPTMKPVAMIEKAITNSSKLQAVVLDSFGGSGSTLIACEKLQRRCYMIEIDEGYCDVIIKRWQDFTGKQAVRID